MMAASYLISGAFVFNLVVRFYPWPAGFSLNNLQGLRANLLGIAFSIAFYAAAMIILAPLVRRGATLRMQFFLVPFLVFLIASPFFRASPGTEVFRDVAFVLLLGSSSIAAIVLNDLSTRQLALALRLPAIAIMASYVGGLAIAFARPGSVAWGSFLLRGVKDRAEFFFFFVPPHICWAVIMLGTARGRQLVPTIRRSAIALMPILLALSFRTHTRTYVIGLVLLGGLLLAVRIGRYRTLMLSLIIVALIVGLGMLPLILAQLRLDSFGKRGIDATNGRAGLVEQVWKAFRSNEAFGSGADAMRRRIENSSSVAKTEYGVLGYVGSFGLLSVPLLVALGLSWWRSTRRLWNSSKRPKRVNLLHVVDCLNLANVPLTFFWLLGSATAFYDWLSFLVAFMCLSPGKLWASGEMVKPPLSRQRVRDETATA